MQRLRCAQSKNWEILICILDKVYIHNMWSFSLTTHDFGCLRYCDVT